MTSELEALKRLLDTASSPPPRDGASGGDVLPGEGAPKPASPLDVDAIMARFDATVGALAEESARADPVSSPTSAHASVPPAVASYDAHVTGAEENVQRLGAAMDDAERELDAAFARHRDSNKHAEALRDAELAASRADADAKQRALESLKETLANTRRVFGGARDRRRGCRRGGGGGGPRGGDQSLVRRVGARRCRGESRGGCGGDGRASRGGFGGARERGGGVGASRHRGARQGGDPRGGGGGGRRARARERARQPRRAEARRVET
jgi:hypothetical protein